MRVSKKYRGVRSALIDCELKIIEGPKRGIILKDRYSLNNRRKLSYEVALEANELFDLRGAINEQIAEIAPDKHVIGLNAQQVYKLFALTEKDSRDDEDVKDIRRQLADRNVFEDIGFSPEESVRLKAQADLEIANIKSKE